MTAMTAMIEDGFEIKPTIESPVIPGSELRVNVVVAVVSPPNPRS
jgi:hypothetical protein